jgi:hypothetical protein
MYGYLRASFFGWLGAIRAMKRRLYEHQSCTAKKIRSHLPYTKAATSTVPQTTNTLGSIFDNNSTDILYVQLTKTIMIASVFGAFACSARVGCQKFLSAALGGSSCCIQIFTSHTRTKILATTLAGHRRCVVPAVLVSRQLEVQKVCCCDRVVWCVQSHCRRHRGPIRRYPDSRNSGTRISRKARTKTWDPSRRKSLASV